MNEPVAKSRADLQGVDRAVARQLERRRRLRRLFQAMIVVFVAAAALMIWLGTRSAGVTREEARELARVVAKEEGVLAARAAVAEEVPQQSREIAVATVDRLVRDPQYLSSVGRNLMSDAQLDLATQRELRESREESSRRLDTMRRDLAEVQEKMAGLSDHPPPEEGPTVADFERLGARVGVIETSVKQVSARNDALAERLDDLERRLERVESRQAPTSYIARSRRSVTLVRLGLRIHLGRHDDQGRYPFWISDLDDRRLYPSPGVANALAEPGTPVVFEIEGQRYAMLLSHRVPRWLAPDYLGVELNPIEDED